MKFVQPTKNMNYLSHGFRFVDDPYFVAGTALPDWMSVLDRRNRARSTVAAVLPTATISAWLPWRVA